MKELSTVYASSEVHRSSMVGASIVVCLIAALLGGWSIVGDFESERAQARDRVQSVTALRQHQVETWLGRQLDLAGFLDDSKALADMFVKWRDGDAAAGATLLQRVIDFRKANDADSVLLLDADGSVLAREHPSPLQASPELAAAVAKAVAVRGPQHTSIYRRDTAELPLRMDVVVPLLMTGTPARGAIVLQLDPRRTLFPQLTAWPMPSATGESMLWREVDGRLVAQSSSRWQSDSVDRLTHSRDPAYASAAAQSQRGKPTTIEVIQTVDYRGEKVLAAMAPVRNTDWLLVSKVDLAEIDRPALRHAVWTVTGLALLLLGLALAARQWLQRVQIQHAAHERERVDTARLQEAIAQREAAEKIHSAEAALRDSDAHYRSVVSVLKEGIVVCDARGLVISCNAAAEKLTGTPQSDWQGRPLVAPRWKLLYPDGTPMPEHETPMGKVLANGEPVFDVLLETVNPAGRSVHFSVSSVPVRSPDTGALIAVVSSFADVTERRRLEADLERHRQQLEAQVVERTSALLLANESLRDTARFNRTVTDSMPGSVAYWDPQRRCRYANRSYAEWFNMTRESIMGLTEAQVFGARYKAQIKPRMDAAMRGEAQLYERQSPRADGTMQIHQVQLVPERDEQGVVHGVLVMAFDITRLKVAEQALLRTNEALEISRDRAEMANRTKSAFLANMSHEIRTPMNAVIGLTHLLERDATNPLQRDRLGKIAAAAKHLLQVINDILDLSKIEAGKLSLEIAEFQLHDAVTGAVEMVRTQAQRKGLELIVEIERLPERVRGDATRLTQMLINLLSNAVKFSEMGWVRVRGEVVRDEASRMLLRLEIQDTGIGIAPDRQSEVFNAFEQADTSTTRHHGGTGLGLALTRELARAMGGEAGLVSAPGIGSTFWVSGWFERADPAAHAVGAQGVQRATVAMPKQLPERKLGLNEGMEILRERHSGRRILLAEDNPVNQEVAEDLLRLASLVVENAPNGAAAIDMAVTRPYDLILMDVQMPVKDGLQASRAIREQGHATPIIAMTANAFLEDRAACLDAGMNDHLGKPVNPSQLYETLLRWLPAPTAPSTSDAGPDLNAQATQPRRVDLLDRLAGIEGVDVEAALRNVGGREQVLARVLMRFVQTYSSGQLALLDDKAADAATAASWSAICVSLEGACSTIAARQVYEAVHELKGGLSLPLSGAARAHARGIHELLLRLTAELAAALETTQAGSGVKATERSYS